MGIEIARKNAVIRKETATLSTTWAWTGNLELISLATKIVQKASITVRESKWRDKGSWDGACVDWSAFPRAAVKQNPNIKSCHCRFCWSMFCCSMFCLATTGTGDTGGDSRSVVCEGCGCVGGEWDHLGRSWDIGVKDRRNSLKLWTMFVFWCRYALFIEHRRKRNAHDLLEMHRSKRPSGWKSDFLFFWGGMKNRIVLFLYKVGSS